MEVCIIMMIITFLIYIDSFPVIIKIINVSENTIELLYNEENENTSLICMKMCEYQE